MLDVRPIKTEADHEWALKEIEAYFDSEPEPGTPEADRFDVLAMLIEAYEEKHWPIDEPKDGLAYLRAVMSLSGRTQKDLADLFKSRSHASKILSGKRELSLSQIRLLVSEWRLSAEILVKPYKLAPKTKRSSSRPIDARKDVRKAATKRRPGAPRA